jgi:hypothetical protein
MGMFINNFSGDWQEAGDSGFHPLEKTELPVARFSGKQFHQGSNRKEDTEMIYFML